jgi:hypothetical protein
MLPSDLASGGRNGFCGNVGGDGRPCRPDREKFDADERLFDDCWGSRLLPLVGRANQTPPECVRFQLIPGLESLDAGFPSLTGSGVLEACVLFDILRVRPGMGICSATGITLIFL